MPGAGCRRCCSLPHGMSSVIAAIVATFAFILGDAAMGTCRYVLLSSGRGAGLYSFEANNYYDNNYYCITANASTAGWDAAWTSARAFAVISTIIGFVCMVMAWVACCVAYRPSVWKTLGAFFALSAVCAMCTMSFFASSACSGGCTFSVGAGLAVGAFCLYAIAACLCFKMPPYEETENEFRDEGTELPAVADAAPGTVTTTETVQADGTRIIEKVTVNADGSKTVETTTEAPGKV